jgi:hypothetical protein
MDLNLNRSFFIPCFCMLYHSTCLGYTSLSYITASFTLDFISIPKWTIFLHCNIFGNTMDNSRWFKVCLHVGGLLIKEIRRLNT